MRVGRIDKLAAGTYRVTFYRKLMNSYGHDFDVALRSFDVRSDTVEDGVDQAIRQFENANQVTDWRLIAHSYQIEVEAGGPDQHVEPKGRVGSG